MGNKTAIQWTDSTWNPIIGCSRVSEGCRHCYAENTAARFRINKAGKETVYSGLTQIVNGHPQWTGLIKETKQLLEPLSWRKPRRVFVNSMSDLFHENVTDEMRDKIFAVMALCPQHTFQVLTKRPARMLEYLRTEWHPRVAARIYRDIHDGRVMKGATQQRADRRAHTSTAGLREKLPLSNLWLGVSVENQAAADERLDYLCHLAAEGWQTMVSFEPLLGPVDPGPWWLSLGKSTWAIVGGESGHRARPMHPDWARGLRDQCAAAGVPFFFKQWGEWTPGENVDAIKGTVETASWFDEWDFDRENLANQDGHVDDQPDLYRIGKRAAGSKLDGVEHKAFPEARA